MAEVVAKEVTEEKEAVALVMEREQPVMEARSGKRDHESASEQWCLMTAQAGGQERKRKRKGHGGVAEMVAMSTGVTYNHSWTRAELTIAGAPPQKDGHAVCVSFRSVEVRGEEGLHFRVVVPFGFLLL